MLELLPLSINKRSKLLDKFNPYEQSWITTSLTSKFHIQKKIILKNILLEDESVMRANEFWQKLLFKVSPATKIKSKELLLLETSNWVKTKKISWASSEKAASNLLSYVEQLIHVLATEANTKLFLKWLEDNPDSYIKWGHWARLTIEYWQHLKSKNEILPNWSAATLIEKEFSKEVLNREYYFDLGTQISATEVELIKKISKFSKVNIVYPDFAETQMYKELTSLYENLGISCSVNNSPKIEDYNFNLENVQITKFSSQLAEIKNTVAQVRELIESGESADSIIITAVQIEEYWPILNLHLIKEGILTYKSHKSKAYSCSGINKWIARLRVETGSFDSSDIEISYFDNNSREIKYEKFRQLYENIFSKEDLKRNKEVDNFFDLKISSKQLYSKDEFFMWSIKYWKEASSDLLKSLFSDIDIEILKQEKFKMTDWVYLLESKALALEINLSESTGKEGVYCENLKDIGALENKHVFILGVCESLLKEKKVATISKAESDKLNNDLGLIINTSESSINELLLFVEVSKNPKSLQISYPEHDFSGNILQPSKVWIINSLLFNNSYKKVNSAKFCRWDKLNLGYKLDLNEYQGDVALFENQINTDLGITAYSSFKTAIEYSLSVSQIEAYESCPFIFSARKLFKLEDLPEVDMDIDRMTAGKFTHSLFEKLLLTNNLNLGKPEILKIINLIKKEERLFYLDQQIWNSLERKYSQLAMDFLNFEKKWISRFPKTKNLDLEKTFEVYWDTELESFVSEKNKTSILFKGIIDRVDVNEEDSELVIIDYKSSAGQAKNYKSWLDHNMYQMGVYSFVIDSGLVYKKSYKVTGAFYYIAKTFNRDVGMRLTDVSTELYDLESAKNSQITTEEKQNYYKKLVCNLKEVLNKINEGDYSPIPKDFKSCSTCKWRRLCRAKHLM